MTSTRFKVARRMTLDGTSDSENVLRKDSDSDLEDDVSAEPGNCDETAPLRQVRFMTGTAECDEDCPAKNTNSNTSDVSYSFWYVTFVHDVRTVEKVPNIDHYRNILSLGTTMSLRPTLAELRQASFIEDMQSEYAFPVVNLLTLLIASQDTDGKDSKPVSPSVAKQQKNANRLGWIQGVLVRCVVCLVGVMMYLRLGWVAGQAGIGLGLVIVLLGSLVSTLTTLSVCAISTNGEVKGGGAYFVISRSLGPEFGGSIGVIATLANATAAAMYIVGFAESVRDIMKEHGVSIIDGSINDIRIISLCTAVVLLSIVLFGVLFETKAQLILLGFLLLSVMCFVIGSFIPPNDFKQARGITGYSWKTMQQNFYPEWRNENFFSVFAVYFPAATGILAGVNISGDLKNPGKAIPRGTLLAIFCTTTTYAICVLITGSTCIRDASGSIEDLYNGTLTDCAMHQNCSYGLLNFFQVLELESLFSPLVLAGMFAASLSSALSSLVSAPKILQALCNDNLFPYLQYFGKGFGKTNEPRRGYILTFLIACSLTTVGDLNLIAATISNFFLATYCLVNYACFDASRSKSPGFRPAFRYYNQWLSLFGAILCLAIMFVIQWWAVLLTFALILVFYLYLMHEKPEVNWGSSSQANAYKNALNAMHRLAHTEEHVKNYRPQILLLTKNPMMEMSLIDFATNITKENGLLICGQVLVHPNPVVLLPTMNSWQQKLTKWLYQQKIKGFYEGITATSLLDGVQQLLQISGLGRLKPNILLLRFKTDWMSAPRAEISTFVNILRLAFDTDFAVCILRLPADAIQLEHLLGCNVLDQSNRFSCEKLTEFKTALNSKNLLSALDYQENPSEYSGNPPILSKIPDECKIDEELENEPVSIEAVLVPDYSHTEFCKTIKKGVIDVFWLFDDGGAFITFAPF
ncbi:unnamed protein product [Soboliphyme baturini]|uniref:Solute carrier family 12 member 1 n=1 Tax=Soboliphyme baturini TaxID=241478 RepID=A0A183ITV9_9BILA|nr:unnamed protein product [Soboliphyme baturini]